MNLDIKTLMLLYVITNVISAGAVALIWSQNRKRFAGISFWLVDMVLQAGGSALIVLRGLVPDFISMTLANAMIQAGALIIFVGLERFTGKKGWQIHNYVLLAAFIAVSAYYGMVQPDLRAREIALSVTSMIYTFQCCWLLLRRADPGMRQITRLTGIVFAVYAAFSFARICLHAIFPTQTSDFFRSGAVDALAITFYIVLSVCLTISLVLMVNRRLLVDVKAQEEKFTTAFRSSPYAITLTRPSDGTIFEVNQGFINITGYQYAEVIGKTTLGLHLWVREEDRQAVTNELAQGHEIRGVEVPFRKKTGEVITGLFSASQVKINNEILVLASIADISEWKRTEEALRESQERLQRAINATQDGLWEWDIESNREFFSPRWCEILGYSFDDPELPHTYDAWASRIHPDDHDRVIEAQRSHLENGSKYDVDYRHRHKSGEYRWQNSQGQAVLDEQGKPIKMVGCISDITERKRAEEALQESEVQYRELFNHMSSGVAVYEAIDNGGDFIIRDFNPAAEKIEKVNKKDILGKRVSEAFPGVKSFGVFGVFQRVWQTGKPEYFPQSIYKDERDPGSWRESWVFKLPTGDIIAVYNDITERKRAEDGLKVSETKYRVLFESLPLGVTVSDKAGNIQEANKEAERLLGLSQETQTQRSIDGQEWQIVHTDGSLMPADEYASVRALRENRVIENVEMGIVKGKDVITWINVTAAPIPLPEYGVAIAYTDITERKQAEEALRVSEVRYRSLFEHMLDGYAYCKMLYDDQGHPVDFLYLDVNSAFERLTGLQDVVGKKVSEAIPGTIESHPELFQSYSRVALTGTPEEFEIDFQPLNKWFSISVYSPTRGYFVAVFEDITERKQLEERIRQVRSDVLFSVSHDLKTPLQVLHQSQEMLSALKPGEALEQFQEYSEIWRRNLQRLERMINNLVDSQRGEEDRFPILLAPCPPEEIVQRVVEDLTGYALALQVQFDLQLEPVPEGAYDQEALARVVENLLTNAVKFSPKGGRVEIRLGMEGDTLLLEVEDHGLGIPANEQKQLFQPFQRGSAQQKGIPGTGLGLYVCRRIVEAHGGTISLQSTEGVGTTVTVTLP